jgi:CHAD domain-containing protein
MCGSRRIRRTTATAAAELVARLAGERRAHTRQLLVDLRGKKARGHARAIYALFTWCAEGNHKQRAKTAELPDASGDSDVRENRRKMAEMLAEQPLNATPAGLHHAHEVRIIVKTCRFGVEALTEDKDDLLPFKQQQDALGNVQDMTVLLNLIDGAIAQTPKRPEPGLEHLSQRSGLQALRANILSSIGANFVTFEKAYKDGNVVLDRLL